MKKAYLLIGEKCNNHCTSICLAPDYMDVNKDGQHICRQFNNSFRKSSFDNLKKKLKNIAQANDCVVFCGGEPCLRKDIFKILNYAKSLNLKVVLRTNGRVFSIFEMAKKTAEYVDEFNIYYFSLDPQIHDKITGVKGSLKQTMKGADNLRKIKKKVNFIDVNNLFLDKQINKLKKIEKKGPSVAHLKIFAFPYTETFVYRDIISLNECKHYANFVIALSSFNRTIFKKVNVFSLPYFVSLDMQLLFLNYCEVLLRYVKPKIFHIHLGVDAVYYLPLLKKYKIPFVVSFRGHDAYSCRYGPQYYKEMFRLSKMILVRSKHMKLKLVNLGYSKEKIIIHHTSLDVKKIKHRLPKYQKTTIKFVSVGRLIELKGHEYLIKAFHKLSKEFDNIRLEIIGEGPLKLKLTELIYSLGLSDKVNMCGYLEHDKVLSKMSNSDIFILHSVTEKEGDKEGIPNVIVEAMALGLPVVSTIHGGISEAIKHNKSGLLVKERDINGIYRAIKKLIRFPELSEKFSMAGRNKVEKDFNLVTQTKLLNNVYTKVINSKP
ncbi:MAG: glycosyltransferase [Nanoarchaeota archaeon]